MGIKGIYNEIGSGERVALAKVAVEKLEVAGRPLRLAIDISIWQFQIQSGKGGKNPALRTLYYRLLKLLALSIQPLFVFDGLNKPPFKRNVKTNTASASLPNMMAKEMLKLFGFPYLTAPGEAEAECALLQREGIVDAVLSEDVDTLMFGCSMSMRNWSSEGSRGNKSPTHVNVYYSNAIKEGKSGLDREGMVLVALMSGGDYIPGGIPHCGVKIACEAARAGFGHDLFELSSKDIVGLRQWRERLEYELRTNESGYFRVKHKALNVPEKFPDREVLRYYTHPVVSSAEKVSGLRESIRWNSPVNVKELRTFVADAFEWHYLGGAFKFLRGLAPALLIQKLCRRAETLFDGNNLGAQAEDEKQRIEAICGRRSHFSTDGVPELRVVYVPARIAVLQLELEETDEFAGIAGNDSEEEQIRSGGEESSRSASPQKKRAPPKYDPNQPEKIWILETFAKLGVPLTVEIYEADQHKPKKLAVRKAQEKLAVSRGGMPKGALDAFVKVTKPSTMRDEHNTVVEVEPQKLREQHDPHVRQATTRIPPKESQRSSAHPKRRLANNVAIETATPRQPLFSETTRSKKPLRKNTQISLSTPSKSCEITPWTLSGRPSDTFDVSLEKKDRYSALGINCSSPVLETKLRADKSKVIDLSSSPAAQSLTADNDENEKEKIPAVSVIQPESPTPGKRNRMISIPQQGKTSNAPSQIHKVTRRTRISTSSTQFVDSPASTSSSLPSPSARMKQAIIKRTDVPKNTKMAGTSPSKVSGFRTSKVNVVLRSSLPGAWKEIEEWQVGTVTPERLHARVDVLDLTRS